MIRWPLSHDLPGRNPRCASLSAWSILAAEIRNDMLGSGYSMISFLKWAGSFRFRGCSREMNGCKLIPKSINLDHVNTVDPTFCAWSTVSHDSLYGGSKAVYLKNGVLVVSLPLRYFNQVTFDSPKCSTLIPKHKALYSIFKRHQFYPIEAANAYLGRYIALFLAFSSPST